MRILILALTTSLFFTPMALIADETSEATVSEEKSKEKRKGRKERREMREEHKEAFQACFSELGISKPSKGERPSEEQREALKNCLESKGVKKGPPRKGKHKNDKTQTE